MNQQVAELRAQLAQVSAALDVSEQADKAKDVQIANLGARLNTALASKVEELQRYRSEFFGRLREVLANRPGVQIVGDRFVFQSEVLFPVGSADLTPAGQDQIRALAGTIKQVAARSRPTCLDHAGRRPCGPAAGAARPVRLQLGAVVAAGDQRGQAADRRGRARRATWRRPASPSTSRWTRPTARTPTPSNRRIELRLTDR